MAQNFFEKASVQVAIVSGISGLLIAGVYIWNNRSQLKRDNENYVKDLKTKDDLINTLKQEIQKKTAEVQLLETQITPFKTIALEKFIGSEQEALRKLADELDELKNYVDPFKKPIASAIAYVEVTIKSEEKVDTTYMAEGGYLAFAKNRKSLLLTSTTKSSARQNGKGEVVYKADFKIQDDLSAIGKPVEILQSSDLIQIMFRKIPENSDVVKGKASIVINGDMRFEFEILPQRMQKEKILIRNIKDKFLKTPSKNNKDSHEWRSLEQIKKKEAEAANKQK